MTCEECGVDFEGDARGWRGYRADWPGEEPEPAFCCPLCAARELGWGPTEPNLEGRESKS